MVLLSGGTQKPPDYLSHFFSSNLLNLRKISALHSRKKCPSQNCAFLRIKTLWGYWFFHVYKGITVFIIPNLDFGGQTNQQQLTSKLINLFVRLKFPIIVMRKNTESFNRCSRILTVFVNCSLLLDHHETTINQYSIFSGS